MTRTIHIVLRLAVTIIGALWCDLHEAQSQDHVFANPQMLSSRDGRLDVDLVASTGSYTINGHQFQGVLYNGEYIPPVWSVRLGDSLTVTLHNRLSEPTNLHFHGLGVSPARKWRQCLPTCSARRDLHVSSQDPRKARWALLVSSTHARECGSANHWWYAVSSLRAASAFIHSSKISPSGSFSLNTIQLVGQTTRNWSQ